MEIIEVKNDVGVETIDSHFEIKCLHCGSTLKISVNDVQHFNYCNILPSQKYNGEFETQYYVERVKKIKEPKTYQSESLLKRIGKSIVDYFVSDDSDDEYEKITTQKKKKIIYPYRVEKLILNYTQCPVCSYNIDVDSAIDKSYFYNYNLATYNKAKNFLSHFPRSESKVQYIYPPSIDESNVENYIIKKYWFKEDFEIPKEFDELLKMIKSQGWLTTRGEDTLKQLAKKYDLNFGFEDHADSIYLFDDYKDRIKNRVKDMVSGNKKYRQYVDKIITDIYTHLKRRTYGKSVEEGLKILDEHINHIKNNILNCKCYEINLNGSICILCTHFKPAYNYELDYQYKKYEKLVKDLEKLKSELTNE